MGFNAADYRGKPVIVIVNTWSDINPCERVSANAPDKVPTRLQLLGRRMA
jgi:dihydroxyacid dehydratase/phosphogluconate dehydratase